MKTKLHFTRTYTNTFLKHLKWYTKMTNKKRRLNWTEMNTEMLIKYFNFGAFWNVEFYDMKMVVRTLRSVFIALWDHFSFYVSLPLSRFFSVSLFLLSGNNLEWPEKFIYYRAVLALVIIYLSHIHFFHTVFQLFICVLCIVLCMSMVYVFCVLKHS